MIDRPFAPVHRYILCFTGISTFVMRLNMIIRNRIGWLHLALALALLAGLLGSARQPAVAAPAAAPLAISAPLGFNFEPVVDGFKQPTGFAFSPDGRIFIIEKGGVVRVFADGELQEEPFIDLSAEVNPVNERGLLGIAIHPRFPAVPYVYLAYAYDPPETKGLPESGARVSRVLRLSADPKNLNRHLPGSGVVILGKNSVFEHIGNPAAADKKPFSCFDANGGYVEDCLPNEGATHALDHLMFGRDGALYVSAGDGINFNSAINVRAQNPDSPVGKILRIDPITGEGLPTNPFYDGNPNSNRSKVYAVGLRNPFRFTLHPRTGQVVVADVGDFDWEEINIGGAGANFGWPCLEGPDIRVDDNGCQGVASGTTPTVEAIYAYPHENGRGSVIGGDFYNGRSYPPYYRGADFFGDFNVGMMMVMTFNADGTVEVADFASGVPGPTQITAGPDGDIYVMTILGALFRLRYSGDAAAAPPISASKETTGTAATEEAAPAASAPATTNAAPAAGTGKILREWWEGIAGNKVADLAKSSKFGERPSGTDYLPAFEAPLSFANDYGQRIRGYLHPPADGEYHFFIAADDAAELWLSTDDDPANKLLIASVPAWTQYRQFDKYPEQQSGGIMLEAGKKYYIEAIHKDADQKDNLAVAWQGPGFEREIIEGKYLSPAAASK
jgi:glucose/arabinose dehydrogenase